MELLEQRLAGGRESAGHEGDGCVRMEPGISLRAEGVPETSGTCEHVNLILRAFRYHRGALARCMHSQLYVLVMLFW